MSDLMADVLEQSDSANQSDGGYVVLARKYRSRHFGELIGQEALVTTLSNAIERGRIHHAYMLSGIRGTGKTSTARIIAQAINYTGADGSAEPTTGPTDDCTVCQAIAQSRHPDVIEIDAASQSGVDNIRELIDGVAYAPTNARYKVYIIDEVHMLSTAAFNALLKTLEEPPKHVVFIFATTELHKVPVTILSRCQRFDLRRIPQEKLVAHYQSIAEKEGVTLEEEACRLIARAADGSARDGMSLLDQAMALSPDQTVTADLVQSMLGQADQGKLWALLEATVDGNPAVCFQHLHDLHAIGSEPLRLLEGLLDLCYIGMRWHITAQNADTHAKFQQNLAPVSRETLERLAPKLTLPAFNHMWQILMVMHPLVKTAPDPAASLEIAMMRVMYSAGLSSMAQIPSTVEASSQDPASENPKKKSLNQAEQAA